MIDQKDFFLLIRLVNDFELSPDELALLKEHLNKKLEKLANHQNYTNALIKETPS